MIIMTAAGLEPTTTIECHFTLKRVRDMMRTYSQYDYYFIKKVLAKEFEVKFECIGENKEK